MLRHPEESVSGLSPLRRSESARNAKNKTAVRKMNMKIHPSALFSYFCPKVDG